MIMASGTVYILDIERNGRRFKCFNSTHDTFATFDESAQKIKQYSSGNYVQMWMRDARTIAAAVKWIPKRTAVMKAKRQTEILQSEIQFIQ